MSAAHWGRSVQSPTDYLRSQLEAERNDLRRSNEAIQKEARKLRSRVEDLQSDVRDAARSQARVEARQQACESMLHQVESRQEEFERRTERREQELRKELRGVKEDVEHLEEVTRREIGSVRREVTDLRQDMDREVREVRREVQNTREHLEKRIDDVRREIQKKADERSSEAKELVDWVEKNSKSLGKLDDLGMTVEGTRIQEALGLARERLKRSDSELALPTAESALGAYQTAHLEKERRLGVMAGSADHLDEVAAELERRVTGEDFQKVFPVETEKLRVAAAELRSRAVRWRERPQWTVFEVERQGTFDQANRLLSLAVELDAVLPGVVERLKERDLRMKEAAAVASEVFGLVDRFETTYANPKDPKSPRILRAFVGRIHLDAHLDLDGTYSYETYGFESADECADTSNRVGRKLAERWHVGTSHFDPSNPQRSSIALPPTSESWRAVSDEVRAVTESLAPERRS